MDDNSTYNNIYRNASPMTPSTPGNAFQTNVNRTKTRKWVEAKKVDYGGDDWGDDFDDDEEPEEPQPPSRVTAGLRPIGQAAQPPTSQPSGNRSVSQPTSAFGHIRGESFGHRNPSGPPALHVQTQQPTPTRPLQRIETEPWTDPATFDEPDHRYPESIISPQSTTSRPFPPLPGYPGRREYSPASQDQGRGSPAPANTGPVSTSRFPPRKSSMGQQDAPPHGNASGSRSGSRPGSSGRPWTQQRSDSPGHQAPASAGTQNKPLPFIRPADIYRRMEEEKEKERRSMDSAGRPSLDSIQGGGQPLSDQRRRSSLDKEDGSDTSRGVKPTLPSVAERRSEYGLDRMINEVGKAFPSETITNEMTAKSEAISSPPSSAAPASASNPDQPFKSPEGGRKSVSPRLPDLARMSGFGTDFFSGPTALPGTDEPAQATLFGDKPEPSSTVLEQEKPSKSFGQLSLASRTTDDVQAAANDIVEHDDNNVHRASSLIKGPALNHDDELTRHSPTSKAPEMSGSQDQVIDPQISISSLNTTVKERANPSRPSIPGGWVTESNLGAETPTPMEQSGTMRSQLSPINDTSEASPVTDLAVGDIAPTTAVKHVHSLETTPKTTPKAQDMEGATEYDFGNSTGKHDQTIANKVAVEESEHHSKPQILPSLQTLDPLPESKPPPLVDQDLPASEATSNDDSPSKDIATYPQMATTLSGFTPTAPLNPKRGDTSASDFVAPSFLPRNFTASSMDTTSPNESDKLREDIMKSLSPIDPSLTKSVAIASSADESPTKSSPEMTRESRYLSGVYDEYMGFNEDKPLRDTTSVWRDEGSTDLPDPAVPRPTQTTDLEGELPSESAQSTAPKSSGHEPFLQRRFSWEQLPEQDVVSPAEEPASQARAPEAVHEVLTTTESTVHKDAPAPALQIEPDNGGTISHQVSLVSSHAPGGLGIAGIEPPSPISVLSSERSPGAIDNPGRRLSLMEEKVLIQASSNPVSPSPEAQHPALATKTPPESSPVLESTNVVAPPKFVNITGWREILSLPSPALRIQKFDETRTQYTEMESGLSNWLEHMRGQADFEGLLLSSVSSTGIPGMAASGPVPNQTSPTGAQPPAQQPYYQQYLNASNDKLASAPPGIVRQGTGNVLSSGRQPTSGFGTSKNQVGTKGKEFLQAAGSFGNKATKAGMKSGLKLFNKGKDKLRGSGDKDLLAPQLHARASSPPRTTAQTVKSRNERRASWGFSLIGSRSQSRQGSKVPEVHSIKHAHSPSFSLIQHLVHRDSRSTRPPSPVFPAANPEIAATIQRPSGTAALNPRPSDKVPHPPDNSHNLTTSTAAALYASSSAPRSRFSLPPLHLSRSDSPTRSRPSIFSRVSRSRPSSWILLTGDRDRRLSLPPSQSQSQSRRNSSLFEVPAVRNPPELELASPIPTLSSVSLHRHQSYFERDESPPPPVPELPKPAPISKQQPSWDPYTATPLVEEEDFELVTPIQAHLQEPLAVVVVTDPIVSDAAQLSTNDRSDGWIEVITSIQEPETPQSIESLSEHPQSMTASLSGQRPVASPLPHPQQDGRPAEASRVSSFVGLPPIRRTSTFGLLGDKKVQSESDNVDLPTAPPEEESSAISRIPASMNSQTAVEQQMHDQFQYNQVSAQQAPQNPTPGQYMNGHNDHGAYAHSGGNGFPGDRSAAPNGNIVPQQQNLAAGPPQAQQSLAGRSGQVPGGALSQFSVQSHNGTTSTSEQPFPQPGGTRPGVSPPAAGNPIHRFPPQGQWKLEESHLSEPLNSSRKVQNSPPIQQPGYYAEDKELESLAPGGPSQPPQRLTRNTGLPPVSAQRFPGLFPGGSSNQSPVQQDQIQIAPAAQQAQQQRRDSVGISRASTQYLDDANRRPSQTGLLNQIGGKFLPYRGKPESASKDGSSVQTDDVSISETSELTDESQEKKHKRASFFGIGGLGNSGLNQQSDPVQASQQFNPPEKKKTFFGAAEQSPGPKKRLSELKDMFKSGSKDDPQVGKPELVQTGRASMQGPARLPTGGSGINQGLQFGQPQPHGQPDIVAPPTLGNRTRSSTQGSVQGSPMGLPPNINTGPPRQQYAGDNRDRKPSAGGFLGGLFGNRPGSSAKEPKPAQGAQKMPPPGQFYMQNGQQLRPGQVPQGQQQFPLRTSFPGQPSFAQVQPGQGAPFLGQPGPVQHPPDMQGQRPGMPSPQSSQHSSQPAGQPGMPLLNAMSYQREISMTVGQPSQASISMQTQPGAPQQQLSLESRPGIPPQQGSQNTLRPEEHDARRPLHSNPVTPSGEQLQTLTAPSDNFSRRSSQDRLSIGGSSGLPRASPNRKPVGSGPSRTASGNIVTLQQDASSSQTSISKPEGSPEPSRSSGPSNEFGGDGQQARHDTSLIQRDSDLGAPRYAEHGRHPSLPSPSKSHALTSNGPDAERRLSSQPNQPQGRPLPHQQAVNGQPVRLPSGQVVGIPQNQFVHAGQLGQSIPPAHVQHSQGGRSQPVQQGPGSQEGPPLWGFTRNATQFSNMTGPSNPQQQQQQQHHDGPGRSVQGPVQEQKGAMSKLFGGANKKRETGSQLPAANQPSQHKEKESTSSKLFGAFKRTKQSEQPPRQQHQQRPPTGPHTQVPMMQGAMQGGLAQGPNQPGQPIAPQLNQNGRGQPMSGISAPQGSSGPFGQQQVPPQGLTQPAQPVQPAHLGRGQMPPLQMLGDRGQLPSQTRVGHGQISPAVLPMMQPNRSQTIPPRQEPQYAAVPIPRGYEAVHGYGVPNMVAASPYNVGRGSPSQNFGPTFQPMMPQHTGASQQVSPMMPQYTGSSQQTQQAQHQMASQHTGTSGFDPRMPSPALPQQAQSPYGPPQSQALSPAPNAAPNVHHQHTSNPPPQQGFGIAQPPVLQASATHMQPIHVDRQASPYQHERQETFLSPSSTRQSEQDLSIHSQNGPVITENDEEQTLRPQPQHIVTAVGQVSGQPQPQDMVSPQNQPLPDSARTFSPVNTAAERLPDPPLPPVESVQDAHDQHSANSISHTPSPPPGTPGGEHPGMRHVVSSFSIVDEPPPNHSLSPDVAQQRPFSVSPEPSGQGVPPTRHASNPHLNVNVNKANSHMPDHEDLYDATPRHSQAPPPHQVPAQALVNQYPNESPRDQVSGAAVAGGATVALSAGALASGDNSRSNSYQVEQPQQQQVQQMEPEEKIVVDEPVELAAVNDDGDDLPTMSATSYPGQEWNPYGAGEFGDWE